MTKVLLSNTNTIWGVIAKPQSSNVYRDVLSFDSEQIKEQFIDDKLFDGQSFKTLLNAQPEISFAQTSALLCDFKVDTRTYPNETFNTLLNKDFAIIENNGIISYYAITSAIRKGMMIMYEGELDIFFTHDVKNMFNDNDTQLGRAMEDRFKFTKDDSNNILTTFPNYLESSIGNNDEFSQVDQDSLLQNADPEFIGHDFKNKISLVGDLANFDNKPIIDNLINNIIWEDVQFQIVPSDSSYSNFPHTNTPVEEKLQDGNWRMYTGLKTDTETPSDTLVPVGRQVNDTILPYLGYTTPTGLNKPESYILKDTTGSRSLTLDDVTFFIIDNDTNLTHKTISLNNALGWSYVALQDVNAIKTSLTNSPISPLSELNKYEISVESTGTDKYGIYIKIYTTITDSKSTQANGNLRVCWKDRDSDIEHDQLFLIQRYIAKRNIKSNENVHDTEIISSNFINHISSLMNPDNKINDYLNNDNFYEPKTELAPFRTLRLSSSTKNSLDLLPQFFNIEKSSHVTTTSGNAHLLTNWGYWVHILNYQNLNNKPNNTNADIGAIFEDLSNYGLPMSENAWNEYWVRNKSQQNTQMLTKSISGVAGFAGGVASANPLGILAGVGNAFSSASSIAQQIALHNDLKRTPNTLKQNGSSFVSDYQYKSYFPQLFEMKIPEQLQRTINSHYLKYGYNFLNKLENINNYLKNRYRYNFIQADQTFENIKLQASSPIKQIINDSIASGITIWHVRNVNDFKGIKVYSYQNPEMSYINLKVELNDN